MPAAVPFPLRQAIARRHQHGQKAPAIAQALGLPGRTVRHLVGRCRQLGAPALVPAYHHGDRPRTKAAQQLRDQALALRREHPAWGAGLIRLFLTCPGRRAQMPTERTLQRPRRPGEPEHPQPPTLAEDPAIFDAGSHP